MVPILVVEMVPVLVVEMVPVLPKVVKVTARIMTAAPIIDLKFFIVCSCVIQKSGVKSRLGDSPAKPFLLADSLRNN